MKKLLLIVCLLFSFAAHAVVDTPEVAYVREWNRLFSVLNNIPEDKKSEPYGLMNYYKVITANNRASGGTHFILPGEVKLGGNVTVAPVVTIVPNTSIKDIIARIKADIDKLILITGN